MSNLVALSQSGTERRRPSLMRNAIATRLRSGVLTMSSRPGVTRWVIGVPAVPGRMLTTSKAGFVVCATPAADARRASVATTTGQITVRRTWGISALAFFLWRPVEQPPLMSARGALELQHANVWTQNTDSRLVALRAGDAFAERFRPVHLPGLLDSASSS